MTETAPHVLDSALPERSCVACRRCFTRNHQLLRFVLDEQSLVVYLDYLGKLPSRGAYVCAQMSCLQRACERGGFARAFQARVDASFERLREQLMQAIHRQMRSLLSLAYRAGFLSTGNSRVEQALRREEGEILLVATDTSLGVQRKFRQWAERLEIPVYAILSKHDLGSAVGLTECSLTIINEQGFAHKIEEEIQRAAPLLAWTGDT